MGVNKVVFGAVSVIDITDSTVTPETLKKGVKAYGADGDPVIGTHERPKSLSSFTHGELSSYTYG